MPEEGGGSWWIAKRHPALTPQPVDGCLRSQGMSSLRDAEGVQDAADPVTRFGAKVACQCFNVADQAEGRGKTATTPRLKFLRRHPRPIGPVLDLVPVWSADGRECPELSGFVR